MEKTTVSPPTNLKPKTIHIIKPTNSPAIDKPDQNKPIGLPLPRSDTGALELAVGAGATAAAAAASAVAASKPVVGTTISANGYDFGSDFIGRTELASGTLRWQRDQRRSRSVQKNAGKPDRQPDDHGGHFIAREFGGPPIPQNHFAQSGAFNRGAYRRLEEKLLKRVKRNEQVEVEIRATYSGKSRRPDTVRVDYYINGRHHFRVFSNTPKGK